MRLFNEQRRNLLSFLIQSRMDSVAKPEQTQKSVIVSDQNRMVSIAKLEQTPKFVNGSDQKSDGLLIVFDQKSDGFCRKTRINAELCYRF